MLAKGFDNIRQSKGGVPNIETVANKSSRPLSCLNPDMD